MARDERRAAQPPRRSHVGTISLLAAIAGALGCRIALASGSGGSEWVRLAAAGFDAAVVGALADWFAVTALFRHPLGIPIPHTAIIPKRRTKIVESIVSMVEQDWLSPEVIGARLARLAPSQLVLEWLEDPVHLQRLRDPLRDLLRAVTHLLAAPEVVEFVERTLQRQLRDVPIDAASGRWLARVIASDRATALFESAALSLANLAERPQTAAQLRTWINRSARLLREDGKVLVPLFLRRRIVQRKIVEAACEYAAVECRQAAADPEHPLRAAVFGALTRLATRLAQGDPALLHNIEQLRAAVVQSLESRPLVHDLLVQLQRQLDSDLAPADGYLSRLIDRQLRLAVIDALRDPERRSAFDQWVRSTADDLLRRHHHQIGLTVRENLNALDTDALVAQIEDRVGADLQFIRLNGAVVGGLIGLLLALAHRFLGSV